MSWGALPWWVFAIEYEAYEAKLLGCMANEWSVEWARSCPQHIIDMRKDMYSE